MKKMNKKSILLLIAVVSMLVVTVGGTVAYLVADTKPVTNIFSPTHLDITVDDTVSGNTKSDVKITINSNIDAYVRVAVIANWCDDTTGQIVLPWDKYTDLPLAANWVYNSADGYYYYTSTVDSTNSPLLMFAEGASYTATNGPEGTHLEMSVIAQVIQAEPSNVVVDSWGVNPKSLAK